VGPSEIEGGGVSNRGWGEKEKKGFKETHERDASGEQLEARAKVVAIE